MSGIKYVTFFANRFLYFQLIAAVPIDCDTKATGVENCVKILDF